MGRGASGNKKAVVGHDVKPLKIGHFSKASMCQPLLMTFLGLELRRSQAGNLAEAGGIRNGHFRENFPVQFDIGLF